jgi:hypothetical protein
MEYIQPFLNSETPFMLLFVALFFYVIKTNRDREAAMRKIIDEDLKILSSDLHVLMGVWKILLQKEVEKEGSVKK